MLKYTNAFCACQCRIRSLLDVKFDLKMLANLMQPPTRRSFTEQHAIITITWGISRPTQQRACSH